MAAEKKNIGILFLDDSETILDLLGRYVESWGYTPYRAKTVEGAKRILRDNADIRLCFIDLNLGKNQDNGFQVIRDFYLSKGKRKLKICMLTGEASPQVGHMAKTQGADAYITKPIGSKKLSATINQLLDESGSPNKNAS